MNTHKLQPYFLAVLLTGIFILTFFVFQPFIQVLILAAVFSVIFKPLYKKIKSGRLSGYDGLAAFLTTLLIILFILVPIAFLATQIFQEAVGLYTSLSEGRGGIFGASQDFVTNLQEYFPNIEAFSANFDQYLQQGLDWFIGHLGSLFSSFAKILLSAFIFFISLYYLFKDGQKFKKAFIIFSPLTDTDDESILEKLSVAINSVIKGSLLVALIQGVLTAIGFAIFGVPNFILWGTVAAIAALIPGIGTALVVTPGILFLFLSGHTGSAFGLLLWGSLAVGLIDNFLGPKLIGRNTELHPLLILLSVLGGITFFGPIGFLLGPLTLSFLFAVIDIYFSHHHPKAVRN